MKNDTKFHTFETLFPLIRLEIQTNATNIHNIAWVGSRLGYSIYYCCPEKAQFVCKECSIVYQYWVVTLSFILWWRFLILSHRALVCCLYCNRMSQIILSLQQSILWNGLNFWVRVCSGLVCIYILCFWSCAPTANSL